ncbi:hypothetical protein [Thalassobacillus hwangdonensis]|uniref:Uncharacterized protein n=1 Tax=Thalassobacillus hwangdonensis TaxID=546108 RepID=A0ABW3KUX3_9BACI
MYDEKQSADSISLEEFLEFVEKNSSPSGPILFAPPTSTNYLEEQESYDRDEESLDLLVEITEEQEGSFAFSYREWDTESLESKDGENVKELKIESSSKVEETTEEQLCRCKRKKTCFCYVDDSSESSTSSIDEYEEIVDEEEAESISAELFENHSVEESPEEEPKECSQERTNSVLVKVPVTLKKLHPQLQLFQTLKLPSDVDQITSVEWSITSFKGVVALPASMLFLQVIVIADIEYTDASGSFHSVGIEVPLEKALEIHWNHPPELTANQGFEYFFGDGMEFHHECLSFYNEEVKSQLVHNHFISHHDSIFNEGEWKLAIKSDIELIVDLVQQQCVYVQKLDEQHP